MLLHIKLFGGLLCNNRKLTCYGLDRFDFNMPAGSMLKELHQNLHLGKDNLVSIVDGKAEKEDFILARDCTVSIFPSMGKREHDYLSQIK